MRWLRIVTPAAAATLAFSTAPHAVLGATPMSKTDEGHIRAIEAAILPAVSTKGITTPTSTLAARMAANNVPGLSIAYIHDGKVAWARAYGVADATGRSVSISTLFQAASISKPVSAMAVMRLVQSGKLNLDADVNQYLRSWKLPQNRFTDVAPVTLRQVLSHTAGLSVHGFGGYAGTGQIPTLLQVLDGEKPANSPPVRVEAIPGTAWRYSGGGYVIAQQLLEDVTGRPFAELARETVLRPAGMTHSFFGPLPPAAVSIAASPFNSAGQPLKEGAHVYPELAPAGLWTTPSELARYAVETQRAIAGKSALIGRATAEEMVKPGLGGYGMGWHVGGSSDHRYIEHGGVNAGFQSELVAYEAGDGVVIMTNSDNGQRLISEVLRTVAHEYGWPDFQPVERTPVSLSPDATDRVTGQYQVGRFGYVAIRREASDVVLTDADGQQHVILPSSPNDWFARDEDLRATFQGDRAGNLIITRFGSDAAGARVSDDAAARGRDELAAKIKAQTQDPNSEENLRRFLEAVARGEPDYAHMTPALAAVVREQGPDLAPYLTGLGAIQALHFQGVGPGGRDIYDVTFATGAKLKVYALFDRDGTAEALFFQ